MNLSGHIKVFIKNNRHSIGLVLVLSAVFWAYYPSLYHFPRGDHLAYLNKVAFREDWYSLAIKSFALNRETVNGVPPGDEPCFRPVLFFVLGNEKFFFGRDFFLWQGFGLFLHLLATAILYLFLCRIKPGFLAAAWTAFFAFMIGSSEAVIWHHINAYVLFALLVLWALERLYVFSVNQDRHDCLWTAGVLMVLASFTFEVGALYAFCMFIYVFLVASGPRTKRLSFIFLLIPVTFFSVSALHFWISGCHSLGMFSDGAAQFSCVKMIQRFFFVIKWQLSSLFLARDDVFISGRMATVREVLTWGWPFNSWGWERIFGSCALSSMVLLFVVSGKRKRPSQGPFLLLLGALLLVYTVSLTVGRVNPRGLTHGLINTLYYLYGFWLLMTVLVYMSCCSFEKAVKGWRRSWSMAAGLLLFVFAGYQALAIHQINQDFAVSVRYYRIDDDNKQGMLSYQKGDFDQAVIFFTRAIKIDPTLSVLYHNRALAYFYKKDYEACWKDVKRAEGAGYAFPAAFLDQLKRSSARAN